MMKERRREEEEIRDKEKEWSEKRREREEVWRYEKKAEEMKIYWKRRRKLKEKGSEGNKKILKGRDLKQTRQTRLFCCWYSIS